MDLAPVPLPDLAATEALAQKLAPHLGSADLLALEGALGAGKTTFARDLLRALGAGGEVPSPTFTLVQIYDLPRFGIAHFDLYRLKSGDELDELGWDEIRSGHLAIVEWPERAAGRMPDDYLLLRFETNPARQCCLVPHGKWAQRLKDIM